LRRPPASLCAAARPGPGYHLRRRGHLRGTPLPLATLFGTGGAASLAAVLFADRRRARGRGIERDFLPGPSRWPLRRGVRQLRILVPHVGWPLLCLTLPTPRLRHRRRGPRVLRRGRGRGDRGMRGFVPPKLTGLAREDFPKNRQICSTHW